MTYTVFFYHFYFIFHKLLFGAPVAIQGKDAHCAQKPEYFQELSLLEVSQSQILVALFFNVPDSEDTEDIAYDWPSKGGE